MKIKFLGVLFSLSTLTAAPYSALVVDGRSGHVLHAVNSDATRHPASLTKAMTLYVVFKKLQEGKVSLHKKLTVSHRATRAIPSKLHLPAGKTISLLDAVKALIVKSANDVAIVVAEGLCGNVETFVKEMNKEAKRLGMKGTKYVNPSGVPDTRQITTARDQITLARALYRDFPKYAPYFCLKSFTHGGKVHHTHNRLLFHPTIDGVKTGYINASGYNVTTSALRTVNGRPVRLFGVVMGGESAKKRDNQMKRLLDSSYQKLKKKI